MAEIVIDPKLPPRPYFHYIRENVSHRSYEATGCIRFAVLEAHWVYGCFTYGHIADKLIITVRLSEDGNVMVVNFRVWRSVLSPEAVTCYACPQFTLVYKLMNKVYTCIAQASL